ncbi:hypothetical protein [Streptomyces sp. H27-H5]|uniref:hypothetical protein n=1 Tax=Streptomyces sp. H27-H5 TaxID=2996460 RepID=UPI0022710B5D|nr:hypothetical protein [Streptomyces sp. H27-H5]MCY0961457.1 hypothetical protein [Streptomyces sp. H27-H5]
MADAVDAEDRSTARRVVTEEQYQAAVREAGAILSRAGAFAGEEPLADAVTAVLAAVGLLVPPPEPELDTCTAQFPDERGDWWQCLEDPGHEPAEGHDAGDWSWSDDSPEAVPARA